MDPDNITNEKGILFGYFNDEEISAYSTGFNSIQDMEKAVKNKEYMIDSFQGDKDFENMTGEEWWNYIIKTINDSYVDGDSYWSMFLIDANKGYKILYCGSEEPNVEIVDLSKQKMNLKFYQNKNNPEEPPYPYFKYGKYEIDCEENNSNNIEVSIECFNKLIANESFYNEDYTLEEIRDNLDLDTDVLSLITDDQKIQFLQTYKTYLEYREAEEAVENKEYEDKKQKLYQYICEKLSIKLDTTIYNLTYTYIEDCKNKDLIVYFYNLLNKIGIDSIKKDEYALEEYTKLVFYYLKNSFIKNFELLENIINSANYDIRQIYEITRGIYNKFTSAEQLELYTNPALNDDQMNQIIDFMKEKEPLENIKFLANPKYSDDDMIWIKDFILDKGLNKDYIDLILFGRGKNKWYYDGAEKISNLFKIAQDKNISTNDLVPYLKKNDEYGEKTIKALSKFLKIEKGDK